MSLYFSRSSLKFCIFCLRTTKTPEPVLGADAFGSSYALDIFSN